MIAELDVVWLVILSKNMLRISIEAHGQGFNVVGKAGPRKKVCRSKLSEIEGYRRKEKPTLEELLGAHGDERRTLKMACIGCRALEHVNTT